MTARPVTPLVEMDGAEVSRLEVTKVTKETQRSSLFEVPAGFNKFERN